MKKSIFKTLAIISVASIVVSCRSNKTSFSSNESSNSSESEASSNQPFSSSIYVTNSVRELRNPGDDFRNVTYQDKTEEEYVAFKKKLMLFSHKLSESVLKREFKEDENTAFSPLSIEMCLGPAIRSSSGQTREELLAALDIDFVTFDKYYKRLYDENNFIFKSYTEELMAELMLTNSIWIDNDITLLDTGLDALRDDYYCYSFEADFNGHNKEANSAIKNFIYNKTNGILAPDLELSTETLFVLMNTLYLKDIWDDLGKDLNYSTDSNHYFINKNQTRSNKQLLCGYYKNGRVMETDDYSSFYTSTNSGFRIYFVKPHDGKELLDVFTQETMKDVLDTSNYVYINSEKLERYHTRCIFPEYTAEGDVDLKGIFQEDFNVHTLFDSRCDFSNLTNEDVTCLDFKQISKLEVNKTGIEGAAVTYMAYGNAAAPEEFKDVYEEFLVNKEFGFLLTRDGTVLFSGVVTNIDK